VLDAGVSLRDVLIAARRADSEPPCCSSSRSPMVGCWRKPQRLLRTRWRRSAPVARCPAGRTGPWST